MLGLTKLNVLFAKWHQQHFQTQMYCVQSINGFGMEYSIMMNESQ